MTKYYLYDQETPGEIMTIEAPSLEQAYRRWARAYLEPNATKERVDTEIETIRENTIAVPEENITSLEETYCDPNGL